MGKQAKISKFSFFAARSTSYFFEFGPREKKSGHPWYITSTFTDICFLKKTFGP